jgi:hypothetical protein
MPVEFLSDEQVAAYGRFTSELPAGELEHLGLERGHRTLTITRKGGEVVTICSRRALPGRSTWPSASAPAHRRTDVPIRGMPSQVRRQRGDARLNRKVASAPDCARADAVSE